MALAKNGPVYRALNRSIDSAVKAGRIDRDAQAALIAAARKVARVMDSPDWPLVEGGKFDNVSASTLLKYCDTLGICPEPSEEKAKPGSGGLARMRSGISVIKAAG